MDTLAARPATAQLDPICALCGHRFTPGALAAHRNAYPRSHPLHRCLDVTELTALAYQRGASGAWSVSNATEVCPSQARRLATLRAERERWQGTGEVPVHERLVPGTRAREPALVPEVRPVASPVAEPTRGRSAAVPADAAANARKREQARLRKRRQRARHVTLNPVPAPSPRGSVTRAARRSAAAASVANLGPVSGGSGGLHSGRVH